MSRSFQKPPKRHGGDKLDFKWLPVIQEERCTGCGLCVEACGPQCLEMINGVPVLVSPDRCGSEEHCIEPCQEKAIRMAWVPTAGDRSVGCWRQAESSGAVGLKVS